MRPSRSLVCRWRARSALQHHHALAVLHAMFFRPWRIKAIKIYAEILQGSSRCLATFSAISCAEAGYLTLVLDSAFFSDTAKP